MADNNSVIRANLFSLQFPNKTIVQIYMYILHDE